jgi:putative Ca2+/H+ antiporter (TMEM165/GDT1 family)
LRFGSIFLASYWTVLVVELVGDKSIYTVASLSMRFRRGLVFAAMSVAFAGKMLAAVLLGQTLVQIPSRWATAASAAVFFSAALIIWFRKPESAPAPPAAEIWSRASLVSFASLFFTEWGDPGQISAAALTAQSQLPLATWLGGTLALMTKGTIAITLGVKLRDRIPERMLRRLASASCCVLGVLALHDAM